MLTSVAADQGWPDVVAGISARISKFAFVLFCYITNHLMTGLLGSSEQCVMFVPRSLGKTFTSVVCELSLSFSSLCRNNN